MQVPVPCQSAVGSSENENVMRRVLKWVAITVAVVLVVALTAPMLLRDKITEIIKREANAMLNARLDFEKLDISLLRHFPNASLDLKGLTLVGVERFEGDTIIGAERISVVVDVMSLFGDEGFEVKKIDLAAPQVHGHKLADGAVNWDVMKPSEEPETEEPEEESSEPSTFRLAVRDFRISDATIRYEDDSTSMAFRTSPASLRLRGDLSAAKSDLDLDLLLSGMNFRQGGIALLSGAEAELNAEIEADMEANRYTLSRNLLRLNAIEMGLDGWVELRDDESVAMDVTAACNDVRFKDILSLIPAFYTRDFRNLTASGELDMAAWARGEMRGSQLPAFELKMGVRNGSFQYASLPKAVSDINIAARVANAGKTLNDTEVDVSQFRLKMAGNALAATLHATNILADPAFRATATGKVDLGAIRDVYPLDEGIDLQGRITADVDVAARMSDIEQSRFEQMKASGTLVVEGMDVTLESLPEVAISRAAATISPQAMTLGECSVKVGRSDVAANGQLTGYLGYLLRGDKLSGRLYIKSELLDLNELMAAVPADEEPAAEVAETTETTDAAAEPLQAIEVPKNLDLSLSTDLKKVEFMKMNISNIAGEMRVKEGTLSLDKLHLGIFDGTATASGSYSTAASATAPAVVMNMSVAGASFSKTFDELEMVQKLVPLFKKTGGDYSMSLNMNTTLDSQMSPDLKSLNASGEIKSANIRIQQLEVFDKLATALNNDKLRKIEAKDVAVRFAVRDGRLSTQPFDLKLGDVKLNLSGSTGLDQTIDYTARVELPKSATGGILETVDVGIGGTFTSPKINLNVRDVAKTAVKNVVDEQVKKLTGSESLEEEIEKQKEKIDAEVEKQKEKLRSEARAAGEKLVAEAEKQRQNLIDAAATKGKLAELAATKAGDKLVEEAKKQSEKLVAEAEAKISQLGKKAE